MIMDELLWQSRSHTKEEWIDHLFDMARLADEQ